MRIDTSKQPYGRKIITPHVLRRMEMFRWRTCPLCGAPGNYPHKCAGKPKAVKACR